MLRLLIILTIASCTLAAKLDVTYEWKYIDYLWKCPEHKNRAISENRYNYKLIFPVDVEKVRDGRVFVTTPAYNPDAVPASLSTVSHQIGPGGPLLKPYPNWEWHSSKNCRGIISVFRVAVDECNRLWVLDTGRIGDVQVCSSKLLVFDLNTDNLLKRVEIPYDISHNPQNKTLGLLITLVVETRGFNCERTWVYMADVKGGGLIVYDGSKMWRLDNNVFHADPDPAESNFRVAGENFTLADGILGLALTPQKSSSRDRLFFRPLASLKEYSLSVSDLHTSAYANNQIRYTTSNYRLPSQAVAQAFSEEGILFFGLTTEIAIACWNLNTPMDDEHVVIVAQDDETLQFASGVKVTKSSNHLSKEELWVLTNRFQKISTDTLNSGETNFRILSLSVDTVVDGSRCRL